MRPKKKHLIKRHRTKKSKDLRIKEAKLIAEPSDAPIFMLDEVNQYFCPFCLHIDYQKAFLMYKGDKPVTYRVQCPDCGQTFAMKTLISDMSIIEFADWVADYTRRGFWEKCDFEKFNARLKSLGWAYLFWGRYRALTGKADEERYNRAYRSIKEEEGLDSGRYGRQS